jgi:hypothetical protein
VELVPTTAKEFSIRKGEPLVVPVCVLSDLPLLHLLDPLLHLHLVHESTKRRHALLTVRYFNDRYFNIESFRQKMC